ncbi:transposable element Tcb2 transposase [Trichonephila clavipes]|nr:transposable element Tcb2 transposase [Trichonephila clavipes]
MPGKRARRHFSQLSEFERGLIFGMKTSGWSTCRVAGQVDRSACAVRNCWSSGHEKVPTRGKPGLERPGRPRGERIEGSYLAEANLESKLPFRALHLTPEHRQLRLQWCQATSMWNVTDWQKGPFLNGPPGAIFQQDNARPHTVRVDKDFLRHFQTLPWPSRSPDLSACRAGVESAKTADVIVSLSVRDLELAVQDLWAHLPQDNIRCLINSMPDRVAA